MSTLSPERLEAILERACAARVLVVGDAMLDVYLRGTASRISPEAPVPVVRVSERWRALGGAANVAANITALGGACDLVACVGEDDAARDLRHELGLAGIGDAGIRVAAERPTTIKTRIMARHQQVARYDLEVEDAIDAECASALAAAVEQLGPLADAIVLEDYNKGVLVSAVIESALGVGLRFDKPVVVDPKIHHFFDYRGATVLKPNLAELETALRAPALVDDAAWMERTRRHLDCGHLLVTLGEDGMALATETGGFFRVPAVARSVYDVSGAGDTVTAVLALALAAGADPVEATVMANHAAAVEVGKAGVATVSPDELRAAIRDVAAGPALTLDS